MELRIRGLAERTHKQLRLIALHREVTLNDLVRQALDEFADRNALEPKPRSKR